MQTCSSSLWFDLTNQWGPRCRAGTAGDITTTISVVSSAPLTVITCGVDSSFHLPSGCRMRHPVSAGWQADSRQRADRPLHSELAVHGGYNCISSARELRPATEGLARIGALGVFPHGDSMSPPDHTLTGNGLASRMDGRRTGRGTRLTGSRGRARSASIRCSITISHGSRVTVRQLWTDCCTTALVSKSWS